MAVHQITNHFGPDRGGAERLAWQLHLDFCAAGLDARLVSLENTVATGPGTVSLGLGSAYDPRALARLGAYVRASVVPGDLVHVHLFPASAHVAALRRSGLLRVPCIFTEHSTSNRRRGSRLGAAIDSTVYEAFSRIVAISEGVENALLAAYPWLAGRTQVIHNGCALPFLEPPERIPADVPIILSIGRLALPKNYPTALAALAELQLPFRYVVLGEGEQRSQLIDLAGSLGIADRVEFVGHQANTAPYLRKASALLIPSLWEGFGLAAVEAMNAGLPVIASDVPGLREVVGEDGDCAVLVDPRDTASVRNGILRVLDAPEAAIAMGRRGFDRAKGFDKRRMTVAHQTLYRQLVEEHARVS
jgi:glycosyltransferase involved in cell wall biosynthesis